VAAETRSGYVPGVRDASYVIAVVVLATLVVTWVLGRLVERLREPLGVVAGLVTRVGVGVILVLVAARAVTDGGFWLALVPVLLVLALWDFAVTAAIIWAWASQEPSQSA
jgi:mannose/fructose/N-acetylgalactosamine-specific phosphotransferase system component IIC